MSYRSSRAHHGSAGDSYLDHSSGSSASLDARVTRGLSSRITVHVAREKEVISTIHSQFHRAVTSLFDKLWYTHAAHYVRTTFPSQGNSDGSLLENWVGYRQFPGDNGPTSAYFSRQPFLVDKRWDRSFFHDVFSQEHRTLTHVLYYLVGQREKAPSRRSLTAGVRKIRRDTEIRKSDCPFSVSAASLSRLSSDELRRYVRATYHPSKIYMRKQSGRVHIRRNVVSASLLM